MNSVIIPAAIIAPVAYAIGGFIAQHTETVQKTEKHPIYTSRGMQLAWEEGFTSEELTEIMFIICGLLFASTAVIRPLTGISMKFLVMLSVVFGVLFATFTETTFVDEVKYDVVEHYNISGIIFAIFWTPFLLLYICTKKRKSDIHQHSD